MSVLDVTLNNLMVRLEVWGMQSSSSSSCCAISTNIPDPFSPPLPIIHCFLQVLRTISRIYTELLYAQAGHPAFAQQCEGLLTSTSLMSLSLLLQQCPACLVHLILIVFGVGGRWPYSCCFVGCCLQDLFNIACSILM